MSQIPALVQSLSPGDMVDMFEIDMSPIGFNVTLYFTPSAQSGNNISFGGQVYVSAAVHAEGFKKNSDGSSIQPVLIIPNIDKGGSTLLKTYGGLIGAKITKRTTFKQFLDFLDDGVTANPDADAETQFMPEIWYVEQKTDHTRQFIKFALSSLTDLQGKQIPNRRIWKNTCERTYRVWDAVNNVFIYENVQCPYTGSQSFDRMGNPTSDNSLDLCGKDLPNCLLRFPDPDTLPAWFMPGVQKVTA